MAEGKAIDKANLELALSENNERLLKYTDAADIALRQDLNAISQYQKYINTELDYCYLTLSNTENVSLSVDYVLPFLKFNGNMETNEINYSAILKAGKTYKISCDLYTADNGRSVFNVFDMTNNKIISYFIKTAAKNDTTASNTNSATIYTPENDCEIQIKVNFISGSQRIEPNQNNYFIIQEIGRSITIDPVEYINTQNGIEDTPVGHIISHMGTTAPKHYLICNGSEYNITDYPYLSQYIEDEYGAVNYFGGDGINTFCVPQVTENMRVNTNADIDLGNKKIITVEFAELSGYDDVVHVPNMTITENENESTYYFLKQTDNKYLVLKKFNAKVIGLVNSFKTASGSKSRGEFRQYRNNTLVQNISYQAPDKTVGSQGTAEGMFSFEEGDIFYFYTPATDGYPQQYGTIIIEDNTVNSISCIKYEPTYYMNITQTISLEEANELKEQNQLLKKQNQLLQQEIEALNVIIDSNKTTI